MSAARAYPLKLQAEVKFEVKVQHAPGKRAASQLDSRNLNSREKEVVKSVRFTVFICLPALTDLITGLLACLPACLPACLTCLACLVVALVYVVTTS